MATNREITSLHCKRCKAHGEITISETDHPYETSTRHYVEGNFIAIEPIHLGAPKVRCGECKRWIVGKPSKKSVA